MNLKHFFLLFVVLAFTKAITAQKQYYDVKLFGNVVGEVIVEKKVISPEKVSYHFDSDAEATLFFVRTRTKAVSNLTYENGRMINAYVYRKKNEEVQELFYKYDGTKYQVKDNGKPLTISKKITYCTANFFLQEPKNINEVFVERLNYFAPIQHLGNGQYLTKVDGGTNLYTYKNGVLQSLKSTKGVSIYMELRN